MRSDIVTGFLKNPTVLSGVAFVWILTVVGILAPVISPYSPVAANLSDRLSAPSLDFFFGTDQLGRDVFSRVLFSFRAYSVIGAVGVLVGIAGSLLLALPNIARDPSIGGKGLPPRGLLDHSMLRLSAIAIVMSPPIGLVLAITFGNHDLLVVGYLGVLSSILPTAITFQLLRSLLTSLRGSEKGPRGVRTANLLTWSTLRNILSLVPLTYSMAFLLGMLLEVPLSFLGAGLRPPTPSLGLMISYPRDYFAIAPWTVLFPLAALLISLGAYLGIVLPIRRAQKRLFRPTAERL